MATNTPPREPRLGIDIGRVIINGPAHPGGGDTAFFTGDEDTMLATPEMPGAAQAIAHLVVRLHGKVWLISKCGQRTQARTGRWLDGHDFYQRTGLPPSHVMFCRARADKRTYCEQLALTHFVDDHAEVHAAIRGVVTYQYFFGPQRTPVPSYGLHTPPGPTLSDTSNRPSVKTPPPSKLTAKSTFPRTEVGGDRAASDQATRGMFERHPRVLSVLVAKPM